MDKFGDGPSTTADVGASNAVLVLRTLYRRDEPVSVPELARTVGLSRPTTEKALSTLMANGVVERGTDDEERRGRPTLLYRLDRSRGVVVGIDVGPRSVRVRVDDLRGPSRDDDGLGHRDVAGGTTLTDRTGPRRRLAAVEETLDAALDEAGVDAGDVWAVTAATPGIVDDTGDVVRCEVMAAWRGTTLRDRLAARFGPGCRVAIENDANLAAVAEHALGAAGDGADVAVVSIGRGLGLGILRDGALRRGAHGQAGELAHVPGSPWATLDATVRAGDPLGAGNRAAFVDQLRAGLHDLAFTLDPELIVLAGPVGAACGPILDDLLPPRTARFPAMPTVALSPLGGVGPVLGASEHARRAAEERLVALATAVGALPPRRRPSPG